MHSAVICISKTPCSNAGMQTLPHANFAWRSLFRAGLLTQAVYVCRAFPNRFSGILRPTRPLQRRVRAGFSPGFPLSRPPSGGTWNLFILFFDIITPSPRLSIFTMRFARWYFLPIDPCRSSDSGLARWPRLPKSLQWHMQPTRPLQRRVRAGFSPGFPLSRPPLGGTWNLFIL